MRPIVVDDVLDLTQYELRREEIYRRTIALKRPRRIRVGGELTFIFENRDTVLFQVQEMIRTERIVKPDAVAAEIAVYNELLPGPDQLSATLMIEITESGRIRETLDRLIGIDEHVALEIGNAEIRAGFDAKQFEEDRISAVQYVRFDLGPALATAFRDPAVPAALRVDHPSYSARTAIEGASRASLAADLDPDVGSALG